MPPAAPDASRTSEPLGSAAASSASEDGLPPPPSTKASRSGDWLRLSGLVLGIALFGYTLRDLDADRLGALLVGLGPLCLLILLPQALGTLVHTAAWKELLAALGSRAPLFALTEVFVVSESVRMAMPAGPALAESYSAYALKQRFQVAWTRGLASVAAKKAWVLCTHAFCLLLLVAFGQGAFDRLAASISGGWALGWVAVGMAVMLTFTGVLTIVLLASRRAGRLATRALSRVPIAKIRLWAEGQSQAPEAKAAAAIPARHHAVAAFFLLAQWATEVLETWLILRLLGVHLSFTEALVVELGGSLVRSLAFVIPGGLGVQDASYVGLLAGLGVGGPEGTAAAFVLLKRAKDIFFVTLGLGLFALDKKRRTEVLASAPAPALIENQT